MTFQEFKNKALSITDEQKQTQFVLNEIFDAQKTKIKKRQNLFVGELKSNWDRTHWFVSELKTIDNKFIVRYPYEINEYNRKLCAYCDSKQAEGIDTKSDKISVLISVKCGRLDKETEILKVSIIRSFSSLNLQPSAPPNDIREAILNDDAFIQERESVLADLEESLGIPELKEEAAELESTIATLKNEQQKMKHEIDKLKNEQQEMKHEIEKTSRLISSFLGQTGADEHPNGILLEEGETPLNVIKNRLDFDYSDVVLLSFLSALSTTQIITLFGKPGTGKTTFVTKIAKALGAKCSVISVQNNWTDSTDLLGYYNPIAKTYESTDFMEALLNAQRDWVKHRTESRLHIICLDEMNLARVEYYFATFLSMLQLPEEERLIRPLPKHIQQELDSILKAKHDRMSSSEEEDVSLRKEDVPGKEYLLALKEYMEFKLPPNIRFVGTINSDDTTNYLSPKVIDRSFYIELTNEQYSQDKDMPNPTDCFPIKFFKVDDELEDDVINTFKRENNRFKKYASQMLKQFRDRLDNNKIENIFDYIVMGKVLPALRSKQEFTGYPEEEFRLSNKAFETHKLQNKGSEYNYLGG